MGEKTTTWVVGGLATVAILVGGYVGSLFMGPKYSLYDNAKFNADELEKRGLVAKGGSGTMTKDEMKEISKEAAKEALKDALKELPKSATIEEVRALLKGLPKGLTADDIKEVIKALPPGAAPKVLVPPGGGTLPPSVVLLPDDETPEYKAAKIRVTTRVNRDALYDERFEQMVQGRNEAEIRKLARQGKATAELTATRKKHSTALEEWRIEAEKGRAAHHQDLLDVIDALKTP